MTIPKNWEHQQRQGRQWVVIRWLSHFLYIDKWLCSMMTMEQKRHCCLVLTQNIHKTFNRCMHWCSIVVCILCMSLHESAWVCLFPAVTSTQHSAADAASIDWKLSSRRRKLRQQGLGISLYTLGAGGKWWFYAGDVILNMLYLNDRITCQ